MRLPVHIPQERLRTPRPLGLPPEARSALLSALDTGTHAIGLFDAAERLVYSNAALRQAWAVDDAEDVTFDLIIRNCQRTKRGAVIATDDIEAWLESARRNRREGPASRAFEVDLWDGRWMWVTERRLDDGWLLLIAQDITLLKQSERMLRLARDAAVKASLTDPLTQLPNRRRAMEVIEGNIGRGAPFHVALIDIDGFKQINDRYGHAAGDDVLVHLAAELAQLTERACFVARLAGDEFVVVSAAGESAPAFEAVLHGLLRQRDFSAAGGAARPAFAMSIGAASFPCHGTDSRQLLVAADAAMYRAKRLGPGGCGQDARETGALQFS